MSYSMRFWSDVLPRQPLTCAQPVRPALHLVAQHVARDLAAELLDEDRPLGTRPDEAHVAAQHVPELRQLVEAGAAQEGAEARAARVVAAPSRPAPSRCLGVGAHRAELEHVEDAAVEPHALLAVEDRAGGGQPDRERDRRRAAARARASASAETTTSKARLGTAAQPTRGPLAQADDRQAVELFDRAAERHHVRGGPARSARSPSRRRGRRGSSRAGAPRPWAARSAPGARDGAGAPPSRGRCPRAPARRRESSPRATDRRKARPRRGRPPRGGRGRARSPARRDLRRRRRARSAGCSRGGARRAGSRGRPRGWRRASACRGPRRSRCRGGCGRCAARRRRRARRPRPCSCPRR